MVSEFCRGGVLPQGAGTEFTKVILAEEPVIWRGGCFIRIT
jgi:hypothetical protein